MDAKRYQQIQALFWETEQRPRDEHESFLRSHVENDDDLIREVLSLLGEHDADAARVEGRSASPVQLPGATKIGDLARLNEQDAGIDLLDSLPKPQQDRLPEQDRVPRKTAGSKNASPTTKKGVPGGHRPNRPGQTIGPAQRTHAAPRHPKTSRRRQQRANTPSSSTSTLPTSIGPPRLKWSWVPLWAFLLCSGIVPVWVAASWIGNNRLVTQREARTRLLPVSLDQARLRVRSLLDEELRLTQRLAETRWVKNNLQSELGNSQTVTPETPPNETIALWDREFRLVAKTTRHPASKQAWNARYAGAVAETLQGQPVFLGPASMSPRQSTPAGVSPSTFTDPSVGWMVPICAGDENLASDDAPIGVLMRTAESLWPRVIDELERLSRTNDLDVYLVDRQGFMQTSSRWSPLSTTIRETVSRERAPFRVAEYRENGVANGVEKSTTMVSPLTIAAASVAATPEPVVHPEPYANYSGGYSAGAWVWLPDLDLGLIVETPVQPQVFGLSLTWPGAMLASLLVTALASAVTWWHQAKVTALTDSRQPLGRYEIQRELGSGGMGVVYLARHKELGRDIALKVLRGDRQDDDDRKRFDREARLAASLSCPHSVTVFDFGYTADDNAFCVMELLEGLTLAEVVARGGSQSPGRVVWILQQICQSMLEAHRKGLMHRDLKPQNVMLRFDGVVGDWATVFDFGLAKPIEPKADVFQTSETIWAGTPMYMAPERFRDPSSMDPRSDIYSIGCIAYYLLAGNPPFVECDPESMFALIMSEHPIDIATHRRDNIDPRLDLWVQDCMRKDKNSRASRIEPLIESLQTIATDVPWTRADAESWWTVHAKELTKA